MLPKNYLRRDQIISKRLLLLIAAFITACSLVITSPVNAYAGWELTSTFEEFRASLPSTEGVQGVFAEGVLAFPVIQQPVGNPAFVSSENDVVTEFSMARDYGTLGLIAHNHLAGAAFAGLIEGQEIVIVKDGGQQSTYRITTIEQYQALSPTSPYSNFINLDDQTQLTATQLFEHTYGVEGRLVLQTCIAANGQPSWGRLFIIAEPITEPAPSFTEISAFLPFDLAMHLTYQ